MLSESDAEDFFPSIPSSRRRRGRRQPNLCQRPFRARHRPRMWKDCESFKSRRPLSPKPKGSKPFCSVVLERIPSDYGIRVFRGTKSIDSRLGGSKWHLRGLSPRFKAMTTELCRNISRKDVRNGCARGSECSGSVWGTGAEAPAQWPRSRHTWSK